MISGHNFPLFFFFRGFFFFLIWTFGDCSTQRPWYCGDFFAFLPFSLWFTPFGQTRWFCHLFSFFFSDFFCFIFSLWENDFSSWLFTFLMYDTQSIFLFRPLRTVKGHEIISDDSVSLPTCGVPTTRSTPLKQKVAHRIWCAGHGSFVRLFRVMSMPYRAFCFPGRGKRLRNNVRLSCSRIFPIYASFPLRKDA